MLKKFIQIFIFAGFWLCFVPWLVICLQGNLINPDGIMEYFIQYTTLLFILIVIYWLINRIVDHCYMKHEVKAKVRKITIQRQLERLERGEIDILEAQSLRTFTKANKPKSPKGKRAASNKKVIAVGKRPKPTEMKVFDANKIEDVKNQKSSKAKAPSEPVSTELPPVADLPPYTDEMKLLEN